MRDTGESCNTQPSEEQVLSASTAPTSPGDALIAATEDADDSAVKQAKEGWVSYAKERWVPYEQRVARRVAKVV